MIILTFPYGPLGSNMYYVNTDSGNYLIDPSVEPEMVSDSKIPVKPDLILITHGHFDHIYAVDRWHDLYPDVPIYIDREDMSLLNDPRGNVSEMIDGHDVYQVPVLPLDELKDEKVKVIKTPGHTKGGVCFIFEDNDGKFIFTGDTLFAGSCGRVDFPGGSVKEMHASLMLLKELDPAFVVYPGHGPSTTIKEERGSNMFMQ